MAFTRVASLDDLWSGEKMSVLLEQKRILLIRHSDGHVYAYEDRCAHQSVAMSRGRIEGDVLVCSAHEWRYDLRTGEGLNPKGVQLKAFPVKVENNEIFVDAEKPRHEL